MANSNNGNKGRITMEEAERFIQNATGDPHGNPPDIAAYLKFILRAKKFGVFLRGTSKEDLETVQVLLLAKEKENSASVGEQKALLEFCLLKLDKTISKKRYCKVSFI